MAAKKPRRDKAAWLHIALTALVEEGVQGVRIERLARDLGVAKSGFYWHFEDRDDLLRELLRYWAEEYTEVIVGNPEIRHQPPRQRLRSVMEMVIDHDLAGYDLVIRAWAEHDPLAARAIRRVYRRRLEFVGAAFAELGFTNDELEMRTRLFVCYHSWELTTFGGSKKSRRSLIDRRLALLTKR